MQKRSCCDGEQRPGDAIASTAARKQGLLLHVGLPALHNNHLSLVTVAMSNPELYEGLVELLAKVTAIVHGNTAA